MPKHAIAGAAALLISTAPGAWAQVSAQDIWSDWQDVFSRFGGTVSAGSEDYSDGTLTLDDVTVTTEIGASEGETAYGTITMVEQDDGTVRIELPQKIESSSTTTVGDVTQTQTMTMESENLSTIVSEADGVRTYDFEADSLAVRSEPETEETVGLPSYTMTFTGMEGDYRSGVNGDAEAFEASSTADSLEIKGTYEADTSGNVEAASEIEAGSFDFTYMLDMLVSNFAGSFDDAPEGPIEGISGIPISYESTTSHSGSVMALKGSGAQGEFALDGTSESGELTMSMGDETLSYGLTSTGGKLTAQVPGFPVPVDMSMAEASSAFTFPFGETGVEKPYAVRTELRDVVIDDALWGLFDPTGQLPRDPATVALDMDGTVVMNVDIFGDPETLAKTQSAPGEVKTLNLSQLLVSAVGAELRGSGALTFPTQTPVPEPVGTIDLALDGGFALADRLVALGVVPAEQVAFIKGMAGAVAEQVGEDQLESTIEFTPGGGITANGLPLK